MKKKITALLLVFCICFVSIPAYAADTGSPLLIIGDVDLDGAVKLADSQLVLRYTLGKVTLTKLQLYLADFNADGKVDSVDTDLILKKALKII